MYSKLVIVQYDIFVKEKLITLSCLTFQTSSESERF